MLAPFALYFYLPLDNTKIKGEVLLDTFKAAFKSNAGASPYLLPNVLRTNIVVPLTSRSGRIALTSNNFWNGVKDKDATHSDGNSIPVKIYFERSTKKK